MVQIPNTNLTGLFSAPYLGFVGRAAAAGNVPLAAWGTDPDSPTFAVAWDGQHCLYLLGQPGEQQLGYLVRLVRERLLPALRERQPGLVKIIPGSAGWEGALPALFPEITMQRLQRLHYVRQPGSQPLPLGSEPAGCTVTAISAALLDSGYAQTQAVCDEIESMWGSLARFFERGFGCCALQENAILGWCTAEYVSPGECGLGVETLPPYQRQGVATAVAGCGVEIGLRRGLTLHWDCWATNLPSVRLAEKLGFARAAEYAVYLCPIVP